MKAAKLLALALAAAPLAVADIIVPTAPRAFSAAEDCDVMAENTVRAILVSKTDTAAVFEVLENLAYNRPVRYGDPKLTKNARFEVSLTPVPGQPAVVAQKIAGMQPGEEATMIVRHLFLFAPAAGQDPNVRPVTRIALRKEAVAPAPTPSIGGVMNVPAGSMHSESVSVTVINGVRTEIRTTTDQLPGQPPVTRKYVNGVEVDPATNAPLTTPAPAAPAAPAPATPAAPQQPTAPAVPALPATPLTPATPATPATPTPATPAPLPATPAAPVEPTQQPAAPTGSTADDESQTIIEN